MKDRILDFTDICVNGIRLFDGQTPSELTMSVSYGVYIHENVNIKKMQDSINRLLKEIDSFRVRLKKFDEGWFYTYEDPTVVELNAQDVSGETLEEKRDKVQEHIIKKTQSVRNRSLYEPVEFELFKLDHAEYFLAIYIDHYISDGHSIGVTIMKLLSYYTGETIQGSVSTGNMHKYISERYSEENEKKARRAAQYWEKELEGYSIEPYQLNTGNTPAFDGHPFCLKCDKREYIEYAAKHKTTVGNLIMAVYHLTLRKTFGSKDNVISYVSTDRNSLQEWGLIAPFVKTLAHRMIADDEESIASFLKKVSRIAGQNMANKDAHIKDIGLNRYGLTYMNHSKPFLENPLFTQWMPIERMDCVKSSFLLLRAQELENTVEVDFICNPYYFNREDYERFINNFELILKRVISLTGEEKAIYI